MKPILVFYVSDQKMSRDFYHYVLNSEPSLDVPGMTEFRLSEGCGLGLMPEAGIKKLIGEKLPDPERGRGIPRAELYLSVSDPNSYHLRALDAGAIELSPLENRNWGQSAAYSMDRDGNVLAFAGDLIQE